MELMALYGLLSPPVSLIGRSCTSAKPASAAQSMNRRNVPVSPMPWSDLRAKGENRDQHPGDPVVGRQMQGGRHGEAGE